MTTNTPTNGQIYDVLRKMLAAMAFEPNLTHPYGSLINDLEPTCPKSPSTGPQNASPTTQTILQESSHPSPSNNSQSTEPTTQSEWKFSASNADHGTPAETVLFAPWDRPPPPPNAGQYRSGVASSRCAGSATNDAEPPDILPPERTGP